MPSRRGLSRLLAPALLAALGLAGCSGAGSEQRSAGRDPGPLHVHALGVNPGDGALFIATHTGLFRAGSPDAGEPERIADRFQDTMGFTVVGPEHFLGSGHPDAREDLPPLLGLIESRDGGRSWRPVSLLGQADFHVLEAAGPRVYGFDSSNGRFLASADGGLSWQRRPVPEPLVSLAIDPADSQRLVASGESGLFRSGDGGRSWSPLAGAPGLLAWPAPALLVVVDAAGQVSASKDAGGGWSPRGSLAGPPAAIDAAGPTLHVALHDGAILRSDDEGRNWSSP